MDFDMRVILEERSGQQFGKLDQVAEGVAEEGETAADGGQHERLGDDRHTARAQLLDGLVNTRHVQTEMVIAGVLQAVAEVAVRTDIPWAWVTAAEDLDIEMIVGRRRDVGELLIGI